MSIEKIADYNIFLEKIMVQWRNSPNLVGIISAAMDQGNKMEDAIFEVRDLMNLDSASGINLDYLGAVWNVDRGVLSDADYLLAIQQKKLQLFSGEPEAIIGILKGSFAGTYVAYSPEYPGKYRVRTDATVEFDELQDISMAGVTGFLSGFIVDEEGNNIVDYDGNKLVHVDG